MTSPPLLSRHLLLTVWLVICVVGMSTEILVVNGVAL